MGIAAALLGLFVIAETFRLGEDTITGGPGTRFLPLALGSIVVALGVTVVLRPSQSGSTRAPGDPGSRARVGGTLVGIIAYALLFERLGYVLSTTGFLTLLLLGYGERRWLVVVAVAGGATAATHAVFATWLRVPLPSGILGP